MEPRARAFALHEIGVAVLAYPPLQLLRHPDAVSHTDAPCKLHIAVAALGMGFEFLLGEFEKPLDSLECHVLRPVFLLFAHDSTPSHPPLQTPAGTGSPRHSH